MAFSVNNNTSNVTIQVTQPYLVVDDEGLKAFAVGVQGPPTGATTNLGGLTDVDNAAVPTNRFIVIGDGAKFVTRGIEGDDLPTIPLSKLVNLTSAQLSATAGILSNQIAGLDASKITGTFPLSLMNQGTTAQFLRGDGTYSNTLTGGLTLGSNLTMPASGVITTNTSLASDTGFVGIYGGGAAIASRGGRVLACGLNNVSYPGGVVLATADASGSVSAVVQGITRGDFTTSGLAVTGAIAASGAVSGTTGTFSGDVSTAVLVSTAGRFYAPAFTNGSLIMRQGSGASQNQISFQNSAGTNRGTIIAANSMFIDYDEHVFRALDTTTRATINSAGLVLGSPNKIIYGAAGTTTAANNEIVGAVGGLRYNVASGLVHTLLVANTAALTVAATLTQVSGRIGTSGGNLVLGDATTGTVIGAATGNTFVGNGAGNTCTASNNIFIGPSAGGSVVTGTLSTVVGYQAAGNVAGATGHLCAFGCSALRYNASSSNCAFGYAAGNGSAVPGSTTASGLSLFGYLSGQSITSGANNSLFGFNSGGSLTTQGNNSFFGHNVGSFSTTINSVAMGFEALRNATGSLNTAVGFRAMLSASTAADCTALGAQSLYSATGSECVGIGGNAGYSSTSAISCTYVGHSAGFRNLTAANVTAIGWQALFSCTGANNTALGVEAGANLTTGVGCIIIGSGVNAQSATGNNQINIGNTFRKTSAGVVSVDSPSGGSVIATVNAATIGTFSATGLAVTGLLSVSGLLQLGGTAPATATSAGIAGQIAWDASGNIYICSATNTWRRVATATF